jgi:AcrR family transcriptional regulator
MPDFQRLRRNTVGDHRTLGSKANPNKWIESIRFSVARITLVRVSEPTERPLRKDAERNRQRILDAARDLFAAKGLEPSLNDIAHHAGVGVGTVYRRFADKEELLGAIFADTLERLTTLAETALLQPNSWDALAWYVEQMCELTATDRGLREIAFSKAYAGPRVAAARDLLIPVMTRLVESAQNDGYVRPELSHADMPLFGLLAGTVTEFAGHIDPDLWRRYVAILLDGMRYRSDQVPLPVNALDSDALELAMETWEPAGPRAERLRLDVNAIREAGNHSRQRELGLSKPTPN